MNFRKNLSSPISKFKMYQRVKYIPLHANGDINHEDCSIGFVNSTNELYVFVKFAKQLALFNWNGTTSQACDPLDLIILSGHWPKDTF